MAVLAYFGFKSYILLTKGDTQYSKKSFFKDLDKGIPENFTLRNTSFDFAFSLDGNLTEDIGYIVVN
jgi:hypothetical protein